MSRSKEVINVDELDIEAESPFIVTSENNVVSNDTAVFHPYLNVVQENTLKYKITRRNVTYLPGIFWMEKREKVIELFDDVFGLTDLREDGTHVSFDCDTTQLTDFLKEIVGYSSIKDIKKALFLDIGKTVQNATNVDLINVKIPFLSIMRLLREYQMGWMDDHLMDLYMDLLNLFLRNNPVDGTISDVFIAKPWDLKQILKDASEDMYHSWKSGDKEQMEKVVPLFWKWVHGWNTFDINRVNYWAMMNFPLRKIITAYNKGNNHWVKVEFLLRDNRDPGELSFLDPTHCDMALDVMYLSAQYYSVIQDIVSFTLPSMGQIAPPDGEAKDREAANVAVRFYKPQDYKAEGIPRQTDSINCGLFTLHYITCDALQAEYDDSFDPLKFRYKLFFFLSIFKLYLECELTDDEKSMSIMEWFYLKYPRIKSIILVPRKHKLSKWLYINPDCYNTSIMRVESFQKYLKGFDMECIEPSSFSFIAAVDEMVYLVVFVGSHFAPGGCVMGRKFVLLIPKGHGIMFHQFLLHAGAAGIADYSSNRLFAYGVHNDASSHGPAVKVSNPVENFHFNQCKDYAKGCYCRLSRRDSWVVEIPQLQIDEYVGEYNIHGFTVFKLNVDKKHLAELVQETVPKTKTKYQNIQVPPYKTAHKFPNDDNPRYQIALTKNRAGKAIKKWNAVFKEIEVDINTRFGEKIKGSCKLEDHKLLFNDPKQPPPEQYSHTDYGTPKGWSGLETKRVKTNVGTEVDFQNFLVNQDQIDDAVDDGYARRSIDDFLLMAEKYKDLSMLDRSYDAMSIRRKTCTLFKFARTKVAANLNAQISGGTIAKHIEQTMESVTTGDAPSEPNTPIADLNPDLDLEDDSHKSVTEGETIDEHRDISMQSNVGIDEEGIVTPAPPTLSNQEPEYIGEGAETTCASILLGMNESMEKVSISTVPKCDKLDEWLHQSLAVQKEENAAYSHALISLRDVLPNGKQYDRLRIIADAQIENYSPFSLYYRWTIKSKVQKTVLKFMKPKFEDEGDHIDLKHMLDVSNLQYIALTTVDTSPASKKKKKKPKQTTIYAAMVVFWPIPCNGNIDAYDGAEIMYVGTNMSPCQDLLLSCPFHRFGGHGMSTFLMFVVQRLLMVSSPASKPHLYAVASNHEENKIYEQYYKQLHFDTMTMEEYRNVSHIFREHLDKHNYSDFSQLQCMKKVDYITSYIKSNRDGREYITYKPLNYLNDHYTVFKYLDSHLHRNYSMIEDFLQEHPICHKTITMPLGNMIMVCSSHLDNNLDLHKNLYGEYGTIDITKLLYRIPKLEFYLLQFLNLTIKESKKNEEDGLSSMWSKSTATADDIRILETYMAQYCGDKNAKVVDWNDVYRYLKVHKQDTTIKTARECSHGFFTRNAKSKYFCISLTCSNCGNEIKDIETKTEKLWKDLGEAICGSYLWIHFKDTASASYCSNIDRIYNKVRDLHDVDFSWAGSDIRFQNKLIKGMEILQSVIGYLSHNIPRLCEIWMLHCRVHLFSLEHPSMFKECEGVPTYNTRDGKSIDNLLEEYHDSNYITKLRSAVGEANRVKRLTKQSAAMYFDLMFQKSIRHMMFCKEDTKQRKKRKEIVANISNIEAKRGLTEYFIAYGCDIDVKKEEVKRTISIRVISKDWIKEIIENKKNFAFAEFVQELKSRHNCKRQVPKACLSIIQSNADLVLERQVTHITIRYARNKQDRKYYDGQYTMSETIREEKALSFDWIYTNFAFNKPAFYELLLKGDIVGQWVEVPRGSAMCTSAWVPDTVDDSTRIQFPQLGKETCVVSSVLSAIYASGKHDYATRLYRHRNESLRQKSPTNFMIDLLRHHPRIYNVHNVTKVVKQLDQLDDTCIYFGELKNLTKDSLHTIAIYDGKIYDANAIYPLELNEANMDWCSGVGQVLTRETCFAGFKRLYKLTTNTDDIHTTGKRKASDL